MKKNNFSYPFQFRPHILHSWSMRISLGTIKCWCFSIPVRDGLVAFMNLICPYASWEQKIDFFHVLAIIRDWKSIFPPVHFGKVPGNFFFYIETLLTWGHYLTFDLKLSLSLPNHGVRGNSWFILNLLCEVGGMGIISIISARHAPRKFAVDIF